MENKDDYLIRYKISIFMYDLREIPLNPATYSELESRSTRDKIPFARRETGCRIYAT